jgi:hypothetical protein
MAVGRISGPLLKANLLRDGVPLAFETDLLYLDVVNGRIGVKTTAPTDELYVNGTSRTTDLLVDTQATLATFTISGSTISSSSGTINIEPTGASPVVYQAKIQVDDLTISGNTIESLDDITIRTNGSGVVNIQSNVEVNGNIHATGNITADGDITFGAGAQTQGAGDDTVTFVAEVASDIIPDVHNTYQLGTVEKQWADVYTENLFANAITTGDIVVDGINLILTQGNIIYVSVNGDDGNSGTHEQDPYLTVKYALSQAVSGDTIYIYPGVYTEIFPMTIPVGVTVRGSSMRSVKIIPTSGTRDKDVFLLNGETTVEDVTLANFEYNAIDDTGYAFRFAANMLVTSRSPYIRNVTVITFGSTVRLATAPADDPRGYLAGDAGRGAFADGSVVNASSKEATMLFHAVTFITPAAEILKLTNGVRIEWLNSFSYFGSKGIHAYSSSAGFAGAGKTRLRINNLTGTWAVGNTVSYYDTDGTTLLASGTIASIAGNFVNLTGRCLGFETITDRIPTTIYAQGNAKLSTAQKKFGTASLVLDGVGDYISHAPAPDFAFPSTITRLPKTITANGNAAVSATQSKFGGSSIAFDGTGDYLSIATDTNYGFGTGDFTIEGWFYKTAVSTQYLFDTRTTLNENSVAVQSNGSGSLRLFVNGAFVLTSSNAHTNNAWNHLAISRASGVTRFFINGVVSTATYTDATNYGTTKPLVVGSQYNGTTAFAGYIDDFRVSNTARYTATFTPTTTAFVDDANTKLLINGNSTIVDDASYGTAEDFTIEGWIYPTVGSAYQTLFDFRSAAIEQAIYLGINTSNQLYLYVNGVITITTAATVSLSTWTHVALVRSNASTKIYINGTQSGSSWGDITNYGTSNPLRIGADYSNAYGFTGYIDEVKISKGIARYTTTFTAPTTALTGDNDTVLLLHFNGVNNSTAILDDGVTRQDIRTSAGGTASIINFADYSDFGAEVRSIGSACVYGEYGVYADGPGVILYLISENFGYIGAGRFSTNDPNDRIAANEVVELNGAKVYYTSVDNEGNFKVGDNFFINQKTGEVNFNNQSLTVTTTDGFIFDNGVTSTTVTAEGIDTGNLRISGNTIESLTGEVNVTAANGQINLQNNTSITGDLDVTGTVTIGGNITIGDQSSDTISFVAGINSNLVPATTNLYDLGTSSLRWQNLYLSGNFNTTGNMTVTGNISSTGYLQLSDVRISGNTVETTTTNTDLRLLANGTGNVFIEGFKADANNLQSVATNSDITITPQGTGGVIINNNTSLKIPVGTDADRPASPTNGMIRYNTTRSQYEGWNGTYWLKLSGVQDVAGTTYIKAEATPGVNDNTLYFYANSLLTATLTETELTVPRFQTTSLDISDNTISTLSANQDINFLTLGTGGVKLGNFKFRNNTIQNTVSGAISELAQTGTGYVKFAGTSGFVIPSGNATTERPSNPVIGMVRFNSEYQLVEVYNGLVWTSVAGTSSGVSFNDATQIGIAMTLTLG